MVYPILHVTLFILKHVTKQGFFVNSHNVLQFFTHLLFDRLSILLGQMFIHRPADEGLYQQRPGQGRDHAPQGERQHVHAVRIGTGDGGVPGLNVVIKTVCARAFGSGIEVLGLCKGWKGIVSVEADDPQSVAGLTFPLDSDRVRAIDRTGGTVLHSSRTNPGDMREKDIPSHLDPARWTPDADGRRDLTDHVITNLEALGIDALVVTGGDDTLGYAAKLHAAGFPVIGVPKTMDNDVWGTDYCLGFSTAVTRSVELVHQLRTPTGSHERISVIELFGRNSGATALYTGLLAGVDRVLLPEVPFDTAKVAELLAADQDRNPSNYAVCVISEGAFHTGGEIVEGGEEDAYGHRKLGDRKSVV